MTLSLFQSESKFFSITIIVAIHLLKMIGLATFSIKSNKNSSKCILTFSKTGSFYNFFLLCLVTIIFLLQFPHLISLSYKHESSVRQFTDIAQGLLCLSTLWVIIATWCLRQNKAAYVMNKLLQIKDKLCRLNKDPFNKMAVMIFCLHVTATVSCWSIICATESVEPVISDSLVNWFFFTTPSFVIFWFIVEYSTVVGILVKNMKSVNNCLANLKTISNPLSCPYYFSSTNNPQLDTLYLIHNIHTNLFELCQEIGEFFSVPILPCVAYSFFSLVYNFYNLLNPVNLQYESLSLTGVVSAVTWMFITLYPLTMLFFNVTKTVQETEETRNLVNKLLTASIDDKVKRKLRQFSLHILHENIKFTAYGFLALDFTLLHSMFGAAATYLVILIQFQ